MKISVTEKYDIQLEEVYNGVILKTKEGNTVGICMRDDTFEFTVKGVNSNLQRTFRLLLDGDPNVEFMSEKEVSEYHNLDTRFTGVSSQPLCMPSRDCKII
jgi:hypothetical protein